jgi:23S rRNA (cytidine2498-2'-O)-methyltransferase
MNTLFMHCRPGFEGEVCRNQRTRRPPGRGRLCQGKQSACAEFVCSEDGGAERLMRALRFAELIFPRQWARGGFVELPETDRISVLLAHLADFPVCGSLWLEVLDTNDGRNCRPSAQVRGRCARP